MRPPKQSIIIAGKKAKKGEVDTILIASGRLPDIRKRYDVEVQEVGNKYVWIEMHNLSRVSRRASKEAR